VQLESEHAWLLVVCDAWEAFLLLLNLMLTAFLILVTGEGFWNWSRYSMARRFEPEVGGT
jgi:hypothetical protein